MTLPTKDEPWEIDIQAVLRMLSSLSIKAEKAGNDGLRFALNRAWHEVVNERDRQRDKRWRT